MTFTIERNCTPEEHGRNAAIFLKDKFPDIEISVFLQAVDKFRNRLQLTEITFTIFKNAYEQKLIELFQNN